MSAEVYQSNFNETGRTFIVSPDFHDYKSYVEKCEGLESPLLSEEIFNKQLNEGLLTSSLAVSYASIQSASNVAEGLGMTVSEQIFNPAARQQNPFVMDNDFWLIASNKYVQIGYRKWGKDAVIGVAAANKEFEGIAENYQLLEKFSLPLSKLEQKYERLAHALYRSVLADIQNAGFDCRRKTSPHTSETIAPCEPCVEETLKEVFIRTVAELDASARSSLVTAVASPEFREDLIKDIFKYTSKSNFAGYCIKIPYVDLDRGVVMLSNSEGKCDSSFPNTFPDTLGLVEYFEQQNITAGIRALPIDESTKSFIHRLPKKYGSDDFIYVAEDEFRRVIDSGFTFAGDENETGLSLS